MNADELLMWFRKGGQVTERWKYRAYFTSKPKKIITLHCPDGGTIPIQRSTLKPLIARGLVDVQHWSGNEYIYRIKS